jgi:N-acetylmuramoyl-L-alanine amidase
MIHSFIRVLGAAALVATVSLATAVTGKICVDAGHGGSDPGATACGAAPYEKTNVLNTCLKFRDWLNADTNDGAGGGSWSVVMTRTTDVFVSLSGRCAISNNNGCNKFMCIHNNAFNCSANGTETFCATGAGATSQDLRNKVQNRMIQAWNRVNRGNKTANFTVLTGTNANAELAELGFIDSSVDNPYCAGSGHQDNAAKHHLYAIQNHYGITAYTPGTGGGVTITIDNSNAGFSCSATWATGTSAADKFGADYRWRSTAAISDPANWSANITSAGTYAISAWWAAGANRSATAPYILPNGTTVPKNQQVSGGSWQGLGSVSLGTGAQVTKLSCWTTSGFIVVADAVRLVK